jgi:hypothetical protein
MDTDTLEGPTRPSTGAERMREYRRRRRRVLWPFKAELDIADAEALAKPSYLAPTDRETQRGTVVEQQAR